MAADDWFRQTDWNPSVEEDFFHRLGRARTQKDQYVVIQALTIAKTFPKDAMKLVDYYFANKGKDFHDVQALLARRDAFISLGKVNDAVAVMKSILEVERCRPQHKTTTFVEFPYLVATRELESEYDAAFAVLAERADDAIFPVDRFKWHASSSLIHAARNERELSKKHAKLALDVAKVTRSPFRFHRNLGLVGKEESAVVDRLLQI